VITRALLTIALVYAAAIAVSGLLWWWLT